MHMKMLSAKWRPFCLDLNVLRIWDQYSSASNGHQSDMPYWTYHNETTVLSALMLQALH